MMPASCNRRDLVRQLDALGVERGAVLVVHTSFKAIGPVEGGPLGLIEALLHAVGSSGTVVMPSFTDWDDDEIFDAAQTPCRRLGIVAEHVLTDTGRPARACEPNQ